MINQALRPPLTALVALVLCAAGPPPLPPVPALTLRDHHDLRCAAAFAVVATAQASGNASARALPPLGIRGKRYLGEVGERIAGSAGLSGPAVRDLLAAQAQALAHGNAVAAAISCLGELDDAVPRRPAPDVVTCLALLGIYADVLSARGEQSALAAELARGSARLAAAARSALAARGLDPAGQAAAIDQARTQMRTAITGGAGAIDADDFAQCRRLETASAG